MKYLIGILVFLVCHSIVFSQVDIVVENSALKTIFIDSSQLKNEASIFDKIFIGNLKSIQIALNEKKNLGLLSLTDNTGETRLEFFDIICTDKDSLEMEMDNTEISKYLSREYFCYQNFKIVNYKDEVSFYYFDNKDGVFRMFLKVK